MRAQGVCAVSLSSEPCLLALPCSATRGDLRIHDLAADGGDVVCEIAAHQQPLVRSSLSRASVTLTSTDTMLLQTLMSCRTKSNHQAVQLL